MKEMTLAMIAKDESTWMAMQNERTWRRQGLWRRTTSGDIMWNCRQFEILSSMEILRTR